MFRNDQLGFNSANTGYFFLFKQGVLQNQDFNLADRVSNRVVDINIEGVNNEDRWLYQLDNVGSIASEWEYVPSVYGAAAEQTAPGLRKLFSTTSRTNDQISLNFGDGVFSAIPVGTFRCYVRASNGLEYIINPEEMQAVVIAHQLCEPHWQFRNHNIYLWYHHTGVKCTTQRNHRPDQGNVLRLDTTHRIAWSMVKTTTIFHSLPTTAY
jgi:hypothetical protein